MVKVSVALKAALPFPDLHKALPDTTLPVELSSNGEQTAVVKAVLYV